MVNKIYMKEINFIDACGDTVHQADLWQNYQVLEQHWEFYFTRLVDSEEPTFYYNKLKELDNRMARLTVILHSTVSAN